MANVEEELNLGKRYYDGIVQELNKGTQMDVALAEVAEQMNKVRQNLEVLNGQIDLLMSEKFSLEQAAAETEQELLFRENLVGERAAFQREQLQKIYETITRQYGSTMEKIKQLRVRARDLETIDQHLSMNFRRPQNTEQSSARPNSEPASTQRYSQSSFGLQTPSQSMDRASPSYRARTPSQSVAQQRNDRDTSPDPRDPAAGTVSGNIGMGLKRSRSVSPYRGMGYSSGKMGLRVVRKPGRGNGISAKSLFRKMATNYRKYVPNGDLPFAFYPGVPGYIPFEFGEGVVNERPRGLDTLTKADVAKEQIDDERKKRIVEEMLKRLTR